MPSWIVAIGWYTTSFSEESPETWFIELSEEGKRLIFPGAEHPGDGRQVTIADLLRQHPAIGQAIVGSPHGIGLVPPVTAGVLKRVIADVNPVVADRLAELFNAARMSESACSDIRARAERFLRQ